MAAMQEFGITPEAQAMIEEMSSLSNNLGPLEEGAQEQVQFRHMTDALDDV